MYLFFSPLFSCAKLVQKITSVSLFRIFSITTSLNYIFSLSIITIMQFWFPVYNRAKWVSQFFINCCNQVPLSLCRSIFNTKNLRDTHAIDLTLSWTTLTLTAWQRPSHIKNLTHVLLHHGCYWLALKNFLTRCTISIWLDSVSN